MVLLCAPLPPIPPQGCCAAQPRRGPTCAAHPPHLPSPPPLLSAPAAAAPSQGACHGAQEQLPSRRLPSFPTYLCTQPQLWQRINRVASACSQSPSPLLAHLIPPPTACCLLTLRRGDGLLRAAFHLHLPPRLRCLLHEGPEQADRMCGGSRALDVVGLCGNPVPCGGRELECVHDSCIGSSQQQDRQGLAGQEMEEEAEIALEEASWEGASTAEWDRLLYQRRSHALFIAMYRVPSAIARVFTSKPRVAQA
ncbi:unnamed protein product [Closterium sp. NIES-54]